MDAALGIAYGVYLVFALGSTFYALLTLLPLIGWRGKAIKPLAAIIVVSLFWFQDTYRHHWSTEAHALDHFEKMLILWETNKSAAIAQMDLMATSERPWDPYDGLYEQE